MSRLGTPAERDPGHLHEQSIPTVQPVISRPMWGSFPSVAALNSYAFVSQLSLDSGKLSQAVRP